MKQLKICVSTYSLNSGGVSTFIFTLAESLLKDGNTVEILSTDTKGNWFDLAKKNGLTVHAIELGLLGWIPFGRVFHARRIGQYLSDKKYDLIINNHSFFVHAASKIFRTKTKFITVIHNQLPEMIERECLSQADAIIGVSKKIYNAALSYTQKEQLYVVINGAKFPPKQDSMKVVRPSSQLKILFVGRIENRQKAVFLIPTIAQTLLDKRIDFEMTLVGTGPDEEQLNRLVKNLTQSEVVQWVGLVSPEMINSYYQSHHVLLLPSYFEGLPLTLIEAMGNGCVPVASLLPDSTDLCIDNGKNGFLIQPGNVLGFVEAFKQCASDFENLKKMSEAAVTKANERFSVTHMMGQYKQIIDELFENQKVEKLSQSNISFFSWKEAVPINLIFWIKRQIKRGQRR